MNEKEIKQQVIEDLETLLELARKGESLRLIAALKSDDKVVTVTVGTAKDAAILLLGWAKDDEARLAAMRIAEGAARRMTAEGSFDEDAQ